MIGLHGLAWPGAGAPSGPSATAATTAAVAGPVEPFDPLALRPLGAGLWWLPGQAEADAANPAGDADARNRGRTANLLVAEDGERLWLLGSGPSPAAARALDAQLQRQFGRRATDVIAPWPHPELVLGQAGLPTARVWAHSEVDAAMGRRCPRCVERLAQRLGAAAADLGAAPIRLADQRLVGEHGRLGPWRWWRLYRVQPPPVAGTAGDQPDADLPTAATVWWHAPSGVFSAHGLLWGGPVPDLRDTRLADLEAAWLTLATLGAAAASDDTPSPPGTARPPLRWLPEEGPLLEAAAPEQHLAYTRALMGAVRQAQREGRDEALPAPLLPDRHGTVRGSVRHQLNWQRLWRQAEEEGWAAAPH